MAETGGEGAIVVVGLDEDAFEADRTWFSAREVSERSLTALKECTEYFWKLIGIYPEIEVIFTAGKCFEFEFVELGWKVHDLPEGTEDIVRVVMEKVGDRGGLVICRAAQLEAVEEGFGRGGRKVVAVVWRGRVIERIRRDACRRRGRLGRDRKGGRWQVRGWGRRFR